MQVVAPRLQLSTNPCNWFIALLGALLSFDLWFQGSQFASYTSNFLTWDILRPSITDFGLALINDLGSGLELGFLTWFGFALSGFNLQYRLGFWLGSHLCQLTQLCGYVTYVGFSCCSGICVAWINRGAECNVRCWGGITFQGCSVWGFISLSY